jgi:molybdopterin synthase catalytic subunit
VVTFVGVVRADRHGSRVVAAIDYDAYVEMAERQMRRLAAEARDRWLVEAPRLRHCVGRVDAGQPSVAIVAAAAHRAEAYAACAFLIEGVKHRVPIWKRELYDDGTSQWAMCPQTPVTSADHSGAIYAHV